MKVNVSWMKEWLRCPRKSYYSNVLNRHPIGHETALDAGTLFHAAMDMKWGKKLPHHEIDRAINQMCAEQFISPEGYDVWMDSLRPVVWNWTPPEGMEFIETEAEKSLQLEWDIELVGRLDAVVRWNGKIWHLQYKTMSTSSVPAVYAEVQRTDWHECAYHAMLAKEYGIEKVGGTILLCVKKLSAKRLAENPLAGVSIHYLGRTAILVEDSLDDMLWVAGRIELEQDFQGTEKPMRNPMSCGGRFGNSLCKYREVCYGGQDINGPGFETREPRYAQDVPDAL